MAWTPASSSARRFHSPESSPNHSNIHSCVPSGLVTNPSRDITILRTTFRSVMSVETRWPSETHRPAQASASRATRRDATYNSAMAGHRIYRTSVASVYPHYVTKAERKGRTKAEVDTTIRWLTGLNQEGLETHLEQQTD